MIDQKVSRIGLHIKVIYLLWYLENLGVRQLQAWLDQVFTQLLGGTSFHLSVYIFLCRNFLHEDFMLI